MQDYSLEQDFGVRFNKISLTFTGLSYPGVKMETHTTNKQLEIERLDENHEWNYRIVMGNPLTGKKDKEFFATSLNINGYGMATESMQISQYQKSIKIEVRNTSVNIILKD